MSPIEDILEDMLSCGSLEDETPESVVEGLILHQMIRLPYDEALTIVKDWWTRHAHLIDDPDLPN